MPLARNDLAQPLRAPQDSRPHLTVKSIATEEIQDAASPSSRVDHSHSGLKFRVSETPIHNIRVRNERIALRKISWRHQETHMAVGAKIAKTADRKKIMDTTKSTDCPKCGKTTRIVKRV